MGQNGNGELVGDVVAIQGGRRITAATSNILAQLFYKCKPRYNVPITPLVRFGG